MILQGYSIRVHYTENWGLLMVSLGHLMIP